MNVADLSICSTSAHAKGERSRIVVRRGEEEIARVEINTHRPLAYVKRYPDGKHARSLRLQLSAAGVDGRSIAVIFGTPADQPRPSQVWFSIIAPTHQP